MISIRAVVFFSLFLLMSCTKADQPKETHFEINLWPVAESDTSTAEPLPSRGDGVIRLANVNHPSMEVFTVEAENPQPAVLIFPGGGYAYMALNKEGTKVAQWFNEIGMTAIVVKYTVPNDREAAFKDGMRAMRLARGHAEEWNIDPDRIGVMGFSAGGHLSARLSTDFNNQNYEAIDAADNLSVRPDFSMLIYPAYLDNESGDELAPEIPISDMIPPTFMVQTKDDVNYVGGTILYNQALDSTDVSKTFHLFEEGGHGYGMKASSEYEVSKWTELAKEWLKEQEIIQD